MPRRRQRLFRTGYGEALPLLLSRQAPAGGGRSVAPSRALAAEQVSRPSIVRPPGSAAPLLLQQLIQKSTRASGSTRSVGRPCSNRLTSRSRLASGGTAPRHPQNRCGQIGGATGRGPRRRGHCPSGPVSCQGGLVSQPPVPRSSRPVLLPPRLCKPTGSAPPGGKSACLLLSQACRFNLPASRSTPWEGHREGRCHLPGSPQRRRSVPRQVEGPTAGEEVMKMRDA